LRSVRLTLASGRLRRILIAYTINRLGTWIGLVALMVAVYDHTHSAPAVAALLFAWQALPAFVVPAVVARVEASRRRSELSALYVFEAVATAALAALLWSFWLPALLLLALLDGIAALAASALLRAQLAHAARDQAASAGTVPGGGEHDSGSRDPDREDAVHEAEREANAALNIAFSVTFVLGPVIGGALVAGAGAPAALFIDVGSFLACGALLIDLHPHVEEAAGNSVRSRLRAAWQHISASPSLRGLLLADAIAWVFFESGPPIEVTYAKSTLHAGDTGFGLLLTAWGVGAVLGSLVFARARRRPLGTLLSAGTLAVGLAYVAFAAAPSLLLACVAALLGGIGNGIELPALYSIVQQMAPQHLHGRLMGAVESLSALAIAIGLPLGGLLVALSSSRAAFLAAGLGAALTAPVLLRLSLRGLQRGTDTGTAAPAKRPAGALGE
jgi:MFS family permease